MSDNDYCKFNLITALLSQNLITSLLSRNLITAFLSWNVIIALLSRNLKLTKHLLYIVSALFIFNADMPYVHLFLCVVIFVC